MKLKDLIAIVDDAYPDGLVGLAFDDHDVGDGLAEFIAREIRDTFEPKMSDNDQIRVAFSAMHTAKSELFEVLTSLEKASEIAEAKPEELPLLVGKYDGEAAAYLERRLKRIKCTTN